MVLITHEEASKYVVSAEVTDDFREITRTLGRVASIINFEQHKRFGVLVREGFTPYKDHKFSVIFPHPDESGNRRVNSLIVVEGKFVFGHSHLFRKNIAIDHFIERQSRVAPLTQIGIDSFSVLDHRARELGLATRAKVAK